jgi:hypothetical protein
MALSQSDLQRLLESLRTAGGIELVRNVAERMLQELIEAELSGRISAQWNEHTEARTAFRNGHREKTLATQAGDLDLAIPKLRSGSFFPSLLERRRRIDQALYAVIMEGYVHGVSTRSVDDLVKALGADSGISKSEVSRICGDLDEQLTIFRSRPLDHSRFPYLYLDATYCKVCVNHQIVSQAVVIATGISEDGGREVLGVMVGDSETEAFWSEFLRSLRERGPGGVRLVISDSHSGLVAAIRKAVRSGAPGDASASVAAVGVLGGLDVLPGDEGQDAHRVRGLLSELLIGQVAQQPQGIGDQRVDQFGAGLLVVPGDAGLARVVVVVCGGPHRCHFSGPGNVAEHRADGGDDLSDGVLRGDRVVQHGGVQGPAVLALQHAGGLHHLAHGLEDTVRVGGTGQPAAEVGQQRRIERHIVQAQPACGLPPRVAPQFLDRLEVRQPVQGLQCDRGGQDLRRHTGPPVRRGIHVREHLPDRRRRTGRLVIRPRRRRRTRPEVDLTASLGERYG